MAELKIADKDMWGYRQVMPDYKVRVRVFAGTEIPPDLVDLESAGNELHEGTNVYDVEANHATLTEEEQAKLQKQRDEEAHAAPEPLSGPVSRSRSQAREAGLAEGRAERSSKGSGKG